MVEYTVELPDLTATQALGARIAGLLRAGDVVALTGGLGAGKTTLSRAIIHAAGHQGEVPSPTFTIIETYDHLPVPLVHADFYRLKSPEESQEIGLDDYRYGAALIAEWPDHAGGFGHEAGCLSITIQTPTPESGDAARRAIVQPGADWLSRWNDSESA
ncbi:tRNA (adenosine(37)-N6)-threonylcarbamoyltransferase complex ATPase subunit type 1 TsaE [Novosphingobium sp. FSY-8]|uniref:tRNA threonylcarbamoyladenosine biosynthesis protein TsaE n=1 Tax=Novosphingobium ovatum TaxID=1908523 RepID=A0ABW9XA32_9SPHN|nr:tRNA (adenosine(37)-N6)-threonylcarbamoyltransferase complex ATPase subunit type 1 TsaE [Novosphingobium ovatum]NBC35377.1 tRNA (adenosine(37)-N6)-threonylcarbamoyltransferase complex ATPase subunit type 1 TsaE [Novosphingobium ovatum]